MSAVEGIPYEKGATSKITRYNALTRQAETGYDVTFSAPQIPFSGNVFIPEKDWPGGLYPAIQQELRDAQAAGLPPQAAPASG